MVNKAKDQPGLPEGAPQEAPGGENEQDGCGAVHHLTGRDLRIYSLVAFGVGYMPHAVIKMLAMNSLLDSGRQYSYFELIARYLDVNTLIRNFMPVLIDSRLAEADFNNVIRRPSLLQANPLLALAPFGLGKLVLFQRSRILLPIMVSLLFMLFYMSGANVSAEKLKFHCIRYILAAVPALYFCSFYFLYCLLQGSLKDLCAGNGEDASYRSKGDSHRKIDHASELKP